MRRHPVSTLCKPGRPRYPMAHLRLVLCGRGSITCTGGPSERKHVPALARRLQPERARVEGDRVIRRIGLCGGLHDACMAADSTATATDCTVPDVRSLPCSGFSRRTVARVAN